jgi:hypothetical protein
MNAEPVGVAAMQKRIYSTYAGIMNDTPSAVFSLCCPTAEERWIDGWNNRTFRLLHCPSGFNEKDCVFQEYSLKPFLFGQPGPTTWITTSYEPEEFSLQFMLIFGDIAVMNRKIHVEALADANISTCHWTDAVSFLSTPPSGYRKMVFSAKLAMFSFSLGYLMKYYCDKGRMLSIPKPFDRLVLRPIDWPETPAARDDFTDLTTPESIRDLVSRYSDLIA